MYRMSKSDWLRLDWSKSNKQLALENRKAISTVNTMRYRLGKSKKRKQEDTDWSIVDWSKNNTVLAKELSVAYNTVARRRSALNREMASNRAIRKDKGISKTTYIPPSEQQEYATKQAQKSKLAGKFETNVHAKHWRILSPDNKKYEFANLHNFIRQNPHLFAEKDTLWKRKGGGRGTGGEYCNVSAGFSNIKSGKTKAWKGWRLIGS